jgi:hypothetical protein
MRELIEAEGGSLVVATNQPFLIRCSVPLAEPTVQENVNNG